MTKKFKVQSSKFKVFFSLVLVFSFLNFACSVPNLEKPECIASRETVKQFYSIHFSGEMKPSNANLEKIKNSLSTNLFENLIQKSESEMDYFTQTADYPKAFRVGGCEMISNDQTKFEILLFWKDEQRSEQREINVETVNQNGKWLIDNVESKN